MITKISLIIRGAAQLITNKKNDSGLLKKVGFVLIAVFIIPVCVMTYLFPYAFNEDKNDPYIEAARNINAEVHMIQDVKIIDMVVFYKGEYQDPNKIKVETLENRYKLYYYDRSDGKNDFDYEHKHFNDIIDLLKEKKLINKEMEKNLLDAIELANHSDPTVLNEESVAITKGDFILPFNHYTITAGTWAYPDGGWHPGVDWGVPTGTKVKAPINMVKIHEELVDTGGYGIWAAYVGQIKNDSYVLIFGHNSRMSSGKSYKQGDIIAQSGNTGASTGPHSHVEVLLFKNRTSNEVIKRYKRNKDYWFGLAYTGKGDCSKICRLRPENVFKVKYGDRR